jgi:RNA polymerase sigma-70 factor, ECF subfamily
VQSAFEDVMRAQERRVTGVAYRLMGRWEDAQDVAQEVFWKLHRNFGRIETSVEAWLYRATVNACWDALRKRRPAAELDREPASEDDPRRELLAREEWRRTHRALQRLGERERAALVLRDVEGLTTRQVAGILGVEEVTVRTQIALARLKLKRMLETRPV